VVPHCSYSRPVYSRHLLSSTIPRRPEYSPAVPHTIPCHPRPSSTIPYRPLPSPAVFCSHRPSPTRDCLRSWCLSSFLMTIVLGFQGGGRTTFYRPVSSRVLGSPPAGPYGGPRRLRTLLQPAEASWHVWDCVGECVCIRPALI